MREEELSCFSFQRRSSLCVKFRLACEVDFPVVWLCEKVIPKEIRCIMLINQTRQTCETPAHSKIRWDCRSFSFWWRDVTTFKWSDKRRGSVAYSMIKQKSLTWHRAGCRGGVSSEETCKKASKKHPLVCAWHLKKLVQRHLQTLPAQKVVWRQLPKSESHKFSLRELLSFYDHGFIVSLHKS